MQLPESGSRRSRGPLSGTHLLQYLSLRLPAFSRFRTLLLVLLLKLLNLFLLSHHSISYALCTGLKQPNASNINVSHLRLLTKSLQPPSFQPHLRSPSSQHSLFISQHHPRYVKRIVPFGMPHLASGFNFLVLSVNLIPVPLSLTCLSMLKCLSTCHSHHP